MKLQDVYAIIQKGVLNSELEYEHAQVAERNLRLAVKEDASLKPVRDQLRTIIHAYQETHWRDEDEIAEAQIAESDRAEAQAEMERQFLAQRRQVIKDRLKELGLKQQDLGSLLGHSKSYMSELMNGVRSLSFQDSVLVHKLLGISLNDLIPTSISASTQRRLRASMGKLQSKNIQLDAESLQLIRVD
ncbi:MAG: helix-turn-helix transcriptional regulator [Bacteroidia bacterium]